MQAEKAQQIKKFLLYGTIPQNISKNKSNFTKLCKNYKLNKKNKLLRKNKIVVMKTERREIFDALHQHSGRTTTWERIKTR